MQTPLILVEMGCSTRTENGSVIFERKLIVSIHDFSDDTWQSFFPHVPEGRRWNAVSIHFFRLLHEEYLWNKWSLRYRHCFSDERWLAQVRRFFYSPLRHFYITWIVSIRFPFLYSRQRWRCRILSPVYEHQCSKLTEEKDRIKWRPYRFGFWFCWCVSF